MGEQLESIDRRNCRRGEFVKINGPEDDLEFDPDYGREPSTDPRIVRVPGNLFFTLPPMACDDVFHLTEEELLASRHLDNL